MITGSARHESWPLKVPFVIARSSRKTVDVVVCTLSSGFCPESSDFYVGRGECQPNPRFGESVDSVIRLLNTFLSVPRSIEECRAPPFESPAARNALDCALLDLECKLADQRAYQFLNFDSIPKPVETMFTISLGSADAMAAAAYAAVCEGRTVIKLKLGGLGDKQRIERVRTAVPAAKLIVDANESATPDNIRDLIKISFDNGVILIEQPLPQAQDSLLADVEHRVPICADESFYYGVKVQDIANRYDMVNIKLDKIGGLRPALQAHSQARAIGLKVMTGCMLGTSLAMAPAMLLAQKCAVNDLDGFLLLAQDRSPAIPVENKSRLQLFDAALWG